MRTRHLDARLRWLLLGAAAVLLLTGLSTRDLWEPDEPRIGAVAEELRSMRHGPEGLVLLHLNGEPYTQKPPLYYWLVALGGMPTGRVSEIAARLPSALSGIAVVALTISFGARLLGGTSGLLGGALLLTVYSFADLARRAQFDLVLALFELAALSAFWRLDRGLGGRRANLALLHGALGLAVLTKGPVGFIVPLLGMALYLAWERRPGGLRHLAPAWALLLSLGPGLAWIAGAVALAPPDFFGQAVGTNVFGRFFAGTSHAQPFYYYLYVFPIEFLPWTLLWPAVWWAGRRRVFPSGADAQRRRGWRLLLAWVGAALLFFSFSSGKRGLYLLPTFPAMALLCADALAERFAGRAALPPWIGPSAAGLGLALALASVVVPNALDLGGAHVSWTVPAAFLLSVTSAAIAWLLLGRAGAPALARFGAIVGGALALELAFFALLLPAFEPTKSPRPIAEAAAAITRPDEPIGLVGSAAKLGGIAFYSGRKIVLLRDAEDVRRFLEAGGRTLVVLARKLERIEEVTEVEVRARLRQGSRSWVVVSPRPAPPTGTGES